MKLINQFFLSVQLFVFTAAAIAQPTVTRYATVSFDDKELAPVLKRAQKELSPREILIVVITPSKDTTASIVYISSVISTAQLEENVPTLIGQFKEYPVLVYLTNTPITMPLNRWLKIKKALSHKLSVHTLDQFRMGMNYDPEVREVICKQGRIVQQQQSIAIYIPGWKY